MLLLEAVRDQQYTVEDILPFKMDFRHRVGGIKGMADDVYDLELACRVTARIVTGRV